MEMVRPCQKSTARWKIRSPPAVQLAMNQPRYNDALLNGFSRSGLATYVLHKPTGLVFDLGECPDDFATADTVFLTHTHLDHSAGVLRWLKMHRESQPTIYVPAEAWTAISNLVGAMNGLDFETCAFAPRVIPVHVGLVTSFKRGNATYNVSALEVDHVVPSVGYRVERVNNKLRAEFEGATADVIKAVKARGESVTTPTVTDRFVFIGDTRVGALRNNPAILDCDTLVMEATCLEPTPHAQEYGHTILTELADVLRAAPRCPTVYIKHFSLRYTHAEIHAAVNALKAEGLPVIAMIGEEV